MKDLQWEWELFLVLSREVGSLGAAMAFKEMLSPKEE